MKDDAKPIHRRRRRPESPEVRHLRTALGESEARFRALFESSHDLLTIRTFPEGQIVDVNAEFESVLGWSRAEALGRTIRELNIDFETGDSQARQDLRKNGSVRNVEGTITTREGRTLWFVYSGRVFESDGAKFVFDQLHDISDRKRAEEALRANDERNRRVIAAIPDGIVVHSGGIIRFANPAAVRLLGATTDRELVGRRAIDFVHRKHRPLVRQRIEDLYIRRAPVSLMLERLVRLDGTSLEAEVVGIPFVYADEPCVMTVFRDVSARIAAEEALAETRDEVRRLFESLDRVVWSLDPESLHPLEMSSACLAVTGYPPEALLEDPDLWRGIVHPDDLPAVIQAIRGAEIGPRSFRYRVVWPGGEVRWLDAHVRSRRDREGKLVRFDGISADVTEQRRVEMELRDSEERFRQLIDAVDEVFWVVDTGTRIPIYVSPAFERMFGVLRGSPTEAFLEVIHPDDRQRAFEQLLAWIEGEWTGESKEMDFRLIRPDGAVRWFEFSAFAVRNPEGRVYRLAGLGKDVTERRMLEEHLRRSQKLEAIGRLAGGVAHDFNNLLTVIQGCAAFARGLAAPGSAIAGDLGSIEEAARRGAELTRRLLVFARQRVVAPQLIDLNAIVEAARQILGRLIGEDVRLEARLQPHLHAILADSAQVEQVLMNLVVNARDAMPEGGELAIETKNVGAEEVPPALRAAGMGPWVRLTVRDTGIGMTDEVRAHLFEPFYTTKDLGERSGVGLATSYGIVAQSGGHILVDSQAGHGSTFAVFFPAAPGTADDATKQPPGPPASGGREKILLVEDESAVRRLTARALESRGYDVLEAASAEEALELVRSGRAACDLLLTDVVMPGMRGTELARLLREHDPHLRILLMSGYPENRFASGEMDALNVGFVAKPFGPDALAERVREALDRP